MQKNPHVRCFGSILFCADSKVIASKKSDQTLEKVISSDDFSCSSSEFKCRQAALVGERDNSQCTKQTIVRGVNIKFTSVYEYSISCSINNNVITIRPNWLTNDRIRRVFSEYYIHHIGRIRSIMPKLILWSGAIVCSKYCSHLGAFVCM